MEFRLHCRARPRLRHQDLVGFLARRGRGLLYLGVRIPGARATHARRRRGLAAPNAPDAAAPRRRDRIGGLPDDATGATRRSPRGGRRSRLQDRATRPSRLHGRRPRARRGRRSHVPTGRGVPRDPLGARRHDRGLRRRADSDAGRNPSRRRGHSRALRRGQGHVAGRNGRPASDAPSALAAAAMGEASVRHRRRDDGLDRARAALRGDLACWFAGRPLVPRCFGRNATASTRSRSASSSSAR